MLLLAPAGPLAQRTSVSMNRLSHPVGRLGSVCGNTPDGCAQCQQDDDADTDVVVSLQQPASVPTQAAPSPRAAAARGGRRWTRTRRPAATAAAVRAATGTPPCRRTPPRCQTPRLERPRGLPRGRAPTRRRNTAASAACSRAARPTSGALSPSTVGVTRHYRGVKRLKS